MTFDVKNHVFVPKHSIVGEAEKKKIFSNHQITSKELPKILRDDPAIEHLKVKSGEIIKITRPSKTAGVTNYYRLVVEG